MTLVKYGRGGYLLAYLDEHQSRIHRSRISGGLLANTPPREAFIPGRIYLFGSKGLLKRVLIERARRVDARTAVDPEQSAPRPCLCWLHAKTTESARRR